MFNTILQCSTLRFNYHITTLIAKSSRRKGKTTKPLPNWFKEQITMGEIKEHSVTDTTKGEADLNKARKQHRIVNRQQTFRSINEAQFYNILSQSPLKTDSLFYISNIQLDLAPQK